MLRAVGAVAWVLGAWVCVCACTPRTELKGWTSTTCPPTNGDTCWSLAWAGSYMFCGVGYEGDLEVLDAHNLCVVDRLSVPGGGFYALVNDDQGRRVAVAAGNRVYIVDSERRAWQSVLQHPRTIETLAWCDDAQALIFTDGTEIVKWSLRAGRTIYRHSLRPKPAGRGSFSHDCRRYAMPIAAKGYAPDITVALWSQDEGAVARLAGAPFYFDDRVSQIAFSRDDRAVAASSHDGVVSVWDVKHRALRARFAASTSNQRLGPIAFSDDGRWLAAASFEEGDAEISDIYVWNLVSGRLQQRIRDVSTPTDVIFSPDGRTLASNACPYDQSGIAACQLSVWDVVSGRRVSSSRP